MVNFHHRISRCITNVDLPLHKPSKHYHCFVQCYNRHHYHGGTIIVYRGYMGTDIDRVTAANYKLPIMELASAKPGHASY